MTNTATISMVRTDTGDDEMHVTGCQDIARKTHGYGYRKTSEFTGTGETAHDALVAAIVAADTEMAGWFCEEPYTQSAAENGCWTTTAQKWAPCFKAQVKGAHIAFATNGQPS